jgi:para-aminobenzoate synthetase component 1
MYLPVALRETVFDEMNNLFFQKEPFFFIIDFLKEKGEVIQCDQIDNNQILYMLPGKTNEGRPTEILDNIVFEKFPETFDLYKAKFGKILNEIRSGNSYLANLTSSTQVKINCTLKDLFYKGRSKYKLWYKNLFVHFSPETFLRIENGRIISYPMKGTIDASLDDAENKILNDKKEAAEHYTIVDLIRNDLSQVAEDVVVDKFRYVEKISTNQKELLQVSSQISGKILPQYKGTPGNIFASMLPAGSICGAPKEKTIHILLRAEEYNRGYFTGVWGVYDGINIDSCVMIRFIEQTPKGLVFKSGGGITALSDAESEYKEMIDKIYVPIF